MPPRIPLATRVGSRGHLTSPRCTIISQPHQLRFFGATRPRCESELPSAKEERRSSMAKSFSSRLDHMQAAIFMAGQKINDLTGYSGIEALKKDIDDQEAKLATAKIEVQEAKAAYKAAIARRSDSQKEVNELLQRKSTWSPADLERFTELYRSDHANEQEEIQAQNRLTDVEKEVDNVNSLLSKSILTRYHEEQVWSDKIRRASTWGTWMLMGINVVLFIVVQLGLEPWKRRRLVNNFEEKVKTMLQEEKAMVIMAQANSPNTFVSVSPEITPDPITNIAMPEIVVQDTGEKVHVDPSVINTEDTREPTGFVEEASTVEPAAVSKITKPMLDTLSDTIGNLFSTDIIPLRQVDLTTYVIEGFAVGVVVAGTTLSFILKSSKG